MTVIYFIKKDNEIGQLKTENNSFMNRTILESVKLTTEDTKSDKINARELAIASFSAQYEKIKTGLTFQNSEESTAHSSPLGISSILIC